MTNKNLPRVEPFNVKKHLPQTSADKTNDLFSILSALHFANEKEKEVTKLTLIKALFKTSQIEAKEKIAFLNTFFYINTLGPHNNVIYKYLEELERANLIKTEGRNIYITSKGSRVMSDLINSLPQEKELISVLLNLKGKTEEYSNNAAKAISDTHSQEVIDTTDDNTVKTIGLLIQEINPRQLFNTANQFKYINPFNNSGIKKVNLPSNLINTFEKELANIEELDYSRAENISSLFV